MFFMIRLLCIAVALVVVASPAAAHGLGVDAKIVDDRLYIEVFFDDDTPADNATLTLTCLAVDLAPLTAKTDDRGRWSIELSALPQAGRYRLFVDAGDGHAVTKVLTIPERAATVATEVRLPETDDRAGFTGTARVAGLAGGFALLLGGSLLWARLRRR